MRAFTLRPRRRQRESAQEWAGGYQPGSRGKRSGTPPRKSGCLGWCSEALKFRTKNLKMQIFLRHLIIIFLRKKTNAEIGKFKIGRLFARGQPPGLYHHFWMTF